MKFHALALCLTGAVVAGVPAAADHTIVADRVEVNRSQSTSIDLGRRPFASARDIHANDPYLITREGRVYRNPNYMGFNGTTYAWSSTYASNLFADLPPIDEVANKVQDLVSRQHHEIASLRAMAPVAQTAGFENVSTVYDKMASDHERLVNFASDWLQDNGYTVPSMPAVTVAADASPAASVDEQIQMHTEAFNRALAMREGERSSTVRTLALWAAATAARHIGILRTLDRDVDAGRRELTALLRSQLDDTLVASNDTEILNRIIEEETAFYRTTETTEVVEAPAPQPTERIVEVERIVEKPVVVERVVEKPVIVERVVERRVFVQPEAPRSRVAGQRQTTRRARRPAK